MFIKRLGYFLVGLSIGIVFLAFFLKKKSDQTGVSFCYFPNCRVLKDLRSKPIYYSDRISEMLQNKEIDTLTINHFFREGEVNFGESDTKSKPCKTYIIEDEIESKVITLKVKNCPERITILELN
jgi:hypothetical protein